MQIFLKNWYDKFLAEVKLTAKLKVVSPFVSEQIIRKIHESFNLENLELITRFNLRDFASNVSSLPCLRFAVECESKVYGVKGLHSKIYIFDQRSVIVTSANFTNGGLLNNYECGVYITDENVVKELANHFNELKALCKEPLQLSQCDQWQREIDNLEIVNTPVPKLTDYGATPSKIDVERTYYVKFFGSFDNRVSIDFKTRDEVERALCHYSCGFSINKKPKQIQEGDIIYMARLTAFPHDYAIFGKAVARKFVESRDKATPKEILERPWKKKYPIYLRVQDPIFLDGMMGDCVLLGDLIRALDYESFAATSRRYHKKRERHIEPKNVLRQQAYVKLTHKGAEWLEPRFQDSINRVGQIGSAFIRSLPSSSI
jgi:hypothetical protein